MRNDTIKLGLLCAGVLTAWGCAAEIDEPLPPTTDAEETSAVPTLEQPLDFASVIDQVHFAYRANDDGTLQAEHQSYTAQITTDQRLRFSPKIDLAHLTEARRARLADPDEDGRVDVASVEVETVGIERGDELLSELAEGEAVVMADGRAGIDRGVAVEQLRNGAEGVEQQWLFDQEPGEQGDLRVRVRLSGQQYVRQTAQGHHFVDPATGLGVRYGVATWIDAMGRTSPVPVEVHGEELVLTVAEAVVEGSTWPALLDPNISPELEIDQPVVAPPTYVKDSGAHDIACADSICMVTWADKRGGPNGQIFVARVTRSGQVLDPGGTPIAGSLGGRWPTVAWASGQEQFIVGWSATDDTIKLVRMDRTGWQGSSATVPSPGPVGLVFPADLACHRSECVVAWRTWSDVTTIRHAINAHSFDVATMTGTTTEVKVVSGPDHWLAEPVTAASPSGDLHVAYMAFQGTNTLEVQSFKPTAGAWASMTATPTLNTNLKPAMDCLEGRCLVAVTEPTVGFTYIDLYLVDTLGSSIAQVGAVSADEYLSQPATVATDGNRFMVAHWSTWTWANGRYADVYTFLRDGTFDNAIQTTLTASNTPMHLTFVGQDYLLTVYEASQGAGSPQSLFGHRISPTLVERPRFPISTPVGNSQHDPVVVFADGVYLLVWADDRAGLYDEIWAARVKPTGEVLDPAGIQVAGGPGQKGNPAIGCGAYCTIAWEAELAATQTDIMTRTIIPASGVLPGSILNLTQVAHPNGGQDDQRSPVVVAVAGQIAVGWEDWQLKMNDDADLAFALINDDYDPDDDNGFYVLTDAADDQTDLALAASGNTLMAAWTDWSHGIDFGADIGGRVMTWSDAEGSFLGAPAFTVHSNLRQQERPAVVYDGNGTTGNFIVAWEDDSDTTALGIQINGTLVSQAGQVVYTRVLLASGDGDDVSPHMVMDGPRVVMVFTRLRAPGQDGPRIFAMRFNRILSITNHPIRVTSGWLPGQDESSPQLATAASNKFLLAFQTHVPLWQRDRVRATFFAF